MATTKAQREKAAAKSRRYRATLKAARAAPDFPVPDPPDDPAGALANWSASTLTIPTGPLRGEPFILAPWQIDFCRDALGTGILEAGCSLPRKCGKSGLLSVLFAGCMVGPLHRPMLRIVVASLTGGLAKELRDAIEALSDISKLGLRVYKSPAPGHILGPNGTRVDFLAADKASGHAIGADLACIEDGGLLPENKRDLWDAFVSSVSGRDGRFLCMSIQSTGAMFSELRERRNDPAVVWHEYKADDDCDIQDRAQWEKAHPPGVLGRVKSYSYMQARSRGCAEIGNDSNFKAHDLNLPVDPTRDPLLTFAQWQHCVTDELPPRSGPAFLGLDSGGSVSMCAIAIYWPDTGRIEAWGAFPHVPNLIVRGRADGVGEKYQKMQERGELILSGTHTTDPEGLIRHVKAELGDVVIRRGAADMYRKSEIKDALIAAEVNWKIDFRRVGLGADGIADITAFQKAVIGRKVRSKPSLLIELAISESKVRRDESGNPALDKRRENGRVDTMSASVLAVGLGERLGVRAKRQYVHAAISIDQMSG